MSQQPCGHRFVAVQRRQGMRGPSVRAPPMDICCHGASATPAIAGRPTVAPRMCEESPCSPHERFASAPCSTSQRRLALRSRVLAAQVKSYGSGGTPPGMPLTFTPKRCSNSSAAMLPPHCVSVQRDTVRRIHSILASYLRRAGNDSLRTTLPKALCEGVRGANPSDIRRWDLLLA